LTPQIQKSYVKSFDYSEGTVYCVNNVHDLLSIGCAD